MGGQPQVAGTNRSEGGRPTSTRTSNRLACRGAGQLFDRPGELQFNGPDQSRRRLAHVISVARGKQTRHYPGAPTSVTRRLSHGAGPTEAKLS
jgi:hypothetical protein